MKKRSKVRRRVIEREVVAVRIVVGFFIID